jgi:hypothetical protein
MTPAAFFFQRDGAAMLSCGGVGLFERSYGSEDLLGVLYRGDVTGPGVFRGGV